MPRLSIEIQGVVQGVGFRPFVYRAALARNLTGWVRNRPDGVEIEVQGENAALEDFLRAMRDEKPAPARIHAICSHTIKDLPADSAFAILASGASETTRPSVPADLALCADCKAEMDTPGERRYRYPFTNCTYCGPRYSIIADLPYDRPRTAMRAFPLCEACEAQYRDPSDRRFHAQPIACPVCGPRVSLRDANGVLRAEGDAALREAAVDLLAGRVLAMKGLGGYQLLVDATSDSAVALLRERKHREEKPFAVMFLDLDSLSRACEVSDAEAAILQSAEAPILLLKCRGGVIAKNIAPGNPSLGAFLPYTPLHELLLGLLDRPLVCTSGNLSDEPMCINDDEAFERLGDVADAFLVHNRPVLRPVDDSVGRVEGGALHLLRRARGFAPLPLSVPLDAPVVLAFGGHMKSTITLLTGGQAVVSQHLGDLDSPQGIALLSRTVKDFLSFFQAAPARLACDLHPDYASTRMAERMAKARGLNLVRVQHHHAHVAACLAELDLQEPALGLAWDGSGYGPDGTVWGGEALLVEGARFSRFGHLRTFPLPGGERAVKEPRRSALGLCWELVHDEAAAADLFSTTELRPLHRMLELGLRSPRTSSIGRLFDAVAALVGIRVGAGFEGQAAMALEFAAAESNDDGAYRIALEGGIADTSPLLEELLADRRQGTDSATMARRFHTALADLALAFAESAGREDVIFTGGCFQNQLLAALCTEKLSGRGFRVRRPALYPPNDGGISLGQAWVAAQWDGQSDLGV